MGGATRVNGGKIAADAAEKGHAPHPSQQNCDTATTATAATMDNEEQQVAHAPRPPA